MREHSGVLGGGVAATFVAVYPGLVLSSIYLMPDSLFALWLVGCLASLHRRPLGWAALAGALAGAAMLTRSLGILLVPTAAAVWAFEWARGDVSWRKVAVRAALFVAVCALVLAPWLNFTAGVSGRPLLDSTSGFNALVGSNPRATGRLEMRDSEWLSETYVRGATSVADADARALRAALAWAADNPSLWARLGITKVANLWGLEGREHSALYSRNYFGLRHDATVRAWGGALLASFPLLVVAALAGALGLGPGWTAPRVAVAAAILITTVLHVLSFGESRFHLPLVPLLAILASGGWPSSQRVSRPQAVAAIAALLFLGWGWTQQLPELRQRLDTLVGPNGSSSVIEY